MQSNPDHAVEDVRFIKIIPYKSARLKQDNFFWPHSKRSLGFCITVGLRGFAPVLIPVKIFRYHCSVFPTLEV